jgi:hypothetical protein
MVMLDIEARKKVGIERYGTVLQPFNGRSALMDAYQEALDLAIYLRQLLYEEEHGNNKTLHTRHAAGCSCPDCDRM